MRSKSSRKNLTLSVSDWLSNPKSRLFDINSKADELQLLEKAVQKILEPEIQKEVRIARVKNQVLHLVATSASLATRLRFDAELILQQLRETSAETRVTDIKIRISPLPFRPPATAAETDSGTSGNFRPDSASLSAHLSRLRAAEDRKKRSGETRPPKSDRNSAEFLTLNQILKRLTDKHMPGKPGKSAPE